MKLIYSDSPDIDALTFRRLMLLGSELTFVERPSIQLEENFGTIGKPSNVEPLKPLFDGSPIKLQIGVPPSNIFSSNFYKEYFKKDLVNKFFIDTTIDGIAANWIHSLYFNPKTNKNEGEFKDFKNWILNNRDELYNIDYLSLKTPENIFKIKNKNDAYFAVRVILSEQSLRTTSILTIAEKYGGNPLSINPFLNKFISHRLSNEIYTGKDAKTRQLGIRLFEAMIPDEALFHLTLEDILLFRERTKSYYTAWEVEINRLESKFLKNGSDFTNKEIQQIVDEEINPKLFEFKQEIRRVRDDQFAKIMKLVKNIGISVITGGTLSTINIPTAIAGFIATNMKTPQITDEIIDVHFKLKDIKMSNGLTYLMKINQLVD